MLCKRPSRMCLSISALVVFYLIAGWAWKVSGTQFEEDVDDSNTRYTNDDQKDYPEFTPAVATKPSVDCTDPDCVGTIDTNINIVLRKGYRTSITFMRSDGVSIRGEIHVPFMRTFVPIQQVFVEPEFDMCHYFGSDSSSDSGEKAMYQAMNDESESAFGIKCQDSMHKELDYTVSAKSRKLWKECWTENSLPDKYQCGHWTANTLRICVGQMVIVPGNWGLYVGRHDVGMTLLEGQICLTLEGNPSNCLDVIATNGGIIQVTPSDDITMELPIMQPAKPRQGSIVAKYEHDEDSVVLSDIRFTEMSFETGAMTKGNIGEIQTQRFGTGHDEAHPIASADYRPELSTEVKRYDQQAMGVSSAIRIVNKKAKKKLRTLKEGIFSDKFGVHFRWEHIFVPNITRCGMFTDTNAAETYASESNYLIFAIIVGSTVAVGSAVAITAGVAIGANGRDCLVDRTIRDPKAVIQTKLDNLQDIDASFPGVGLSIERDITLTSSGDPASTIKSTFTNLENQPATLHLYSTKLRSNQFLFQGTVANLRVPICQWRTDGRTSTCVLSFDWTGNVGDIGMRTKTAMVQMTTQSIFLEEGKGAYEAYYMSTSSPPSIELCLKLKDSEVCAISEQVDDIDITQPGGTIPGDGGSNTVGTSRGYFTWLFSSWWVLWWIFEKLVTAVVVFSFVQLMRHWALPKFTVLLASGIPVSDAIMNHETKLVRICVDFEEGWLSWITLSMIVSFVIVFIACMTRPNGRTIAMIMIALLVVNLKAVSAQDDPSKTAMYPVRNEADLAKVKLISGSSVTQVLANMNIIAIHERISWDDGTNEISTITRYVWTTPDGYVCKFHPEETRHISWLMTVLTECLTYEREIKEQIIEVENRVSRMIETFEMEKVVCRLFGFIVTLALIVAVFGRRRMYISLMVAMQRLNTAEATDDCKIKVTRYCYTMTETKYRVMEYAFYVFVGIIILRLVRGKCMKTRIMMTVVAILAMIGGANAYSAGNRYDCTEIRTVNKTNYFVLKTPYRIDSVTLRGTSEKAVRDNGMSDFHSVSLQSIIIDEQEALITKGDNVVVSGYINLGNPFNCYARERGIVVKDYTIGTRKVADEYVTVSVTLPAYSRCGPDTKRSAENEDLRNYMYSGGFGTVGYTYITDRDGLYPDIGDSLVFYLYGGVPGTDRSVMVDNTHCLFTRVINEASVVSSTCDQEHTVVPFCFMSSSTDYASTVPGPYLRTIKQGLNPNTTRFRRDSEGKVMRNSFVNQQLATMAILDSTDLHQGAPTTHMEEQFSGVPGAGVLALMPFHVWHPEQEFCADTPIGYMSYGKTRMLERSRVLHEGVGAECDNSTCPAHTVTQEVINNFHENCLLKEGQVGYNNLMRSYISATCDDLPRGVSCNNAIYTRTIMRSSVEAPYNFLLTATCIKQMQSGLLEVLQYVAYSNRQVPKTVESPVGVVVMVTPPQGISYTSVVIKVVCLHFGDNVLDCETLLYGLVAGAVSGQGHTTLLTIRTLLHNGEGVEIGVMMTGLVSCNLGCELSVHTCLGTKHISIRAPFTPTSRSSEEVLMSWNNRLITVKRKVGTCPVSMRPGEVLFRGDFAITAGLDGISEYPFIFVGYNNGLMVSAVIVDYTVICERTQIVPMEVEGMLVATQVGYNYIVAGVIDYREMGPSLVQVKGLPAVDQPHLIYDSNRKPRIGTEQDILMSMGPAGSTIWVCTMDSTKSVTTTNAMTVYSGSHGWWQERDQNWKGLMIIQYLAIGLLAVGPGIVVGVGILVEWWNHSGEFKRLRTLIKLRLGDPTGCEMGILTKEDIEWMQRRLVKANLNKCVKTLKAWWNASPKELSDRMRLTRALCITSAQCDTVIIAIDNPVIKGVRQEKVTPVSVITIPDEDIFKAVPDNRSLFHEISMEDGIALGMDHTTYQALSSVSRRLSPMPPASVDGLDI